MRSSSGIGLALSLVFGCLLLALLLELYYMLCWKKRIAFQRQQQVVDDDEDEEEDTLSSRSSSAREFLYMFCCKKLSSLSSCAALNPQEICASLRTKQQQFSIDKDDLALKSDDGFLCPPRYLFTIMEETMEDLESDGDDDGSGSKPMKCRKGSKSLHELMLLSVETHTPYLTPLSSPQFITPAIHEYSSTSPSQHGFNPFLESSSDAEISKIKATPPPKFRFLQAAEEKYNRRKIMEEEPVDDVGHCKAPTFSQDSFITIVIGDHSHDRAQ